MEKFKNPLVTPCGHLTCEPCIKHHVRLSPHPYEAKCPICRAPFPTGILADLSTLPKKYHGFALPPLRRVYLGDGEDNTRAEIDDLKLEIANLKAQIETLNRDKIESSLRDWLLGAHWALEEKRLALDQAREEARAALDEAKEETRIANQSLEELSAEYDALKLQVMNPFTAMNTKRTSGQAALDNPPLNSVGASPHGIEQGRPIKPLPKRAKLDTFINSWSPFKFSLPLLDFARPPTLSGPTGQTGSSGIAAGSNASLLDPFTYHMASGATSKLSTQTPLSTPSPAHPQSIY